MNCQRTVTTNFNGIPYLTTTNVVVTETEVSLALGFRPIPPVGYFTVRIANAIPTGTTGTLPVNLTLNGNSRALTFFNGVPVTAADLTGTGEWLLVYCEEKLYDERQQYHKDFVLKNTDFTDGFIYPRLFRVELGDIFTTNTFGANTSNTAEVNGIALAEGEYVDVNANTGFLKKATTLNDATVPAFQVAKVYTMPDGQPGVKLQRVK